MSGAVKPVTDLKGTFELLTGAAKGVGQDLLADLKDAGQTALTALSEEGKDLLTKSDEELAKAAAEVTRDSKQ